jgi:hypothetical protein
VCMSLRPADARANPLLELRTNFHGSAESQPCNKMPLTRVSHIDWLLLPSRYSPDLRARSFVVVVVVILAVAIVFGKIIFSAAVGLGGSCSPWPWMLSARGIVSQQIAGVSACCESGCCGRCVCGRFKNLSGGNPRQTECAVGQDDREQNVAAGLVSRRWERCRA